MGPQRMTPARDLAGMQFGMLTVTARVEAGRRRQERRGSRNAEWECICACGRSKVVRSDVLIQGRTRSCGCLSSRLSSERRRGRPFGSRLVAEEVAP